MSVTLFYGKSECFGLMKDDTVLGSPYDRVGEQVDDEQELEQDATAAVFKKICMDVPEEASGKLWSTERIKGAVLVGFHDKLIPRLITRKQCAWSCIHERSFTCRSATFQIVGAGERDPNMDGPYAATENPFSVAPLPDIQQDLRATGGTAEILGRCTLSREDKYTQPESFRVSNMDFEYIENECVEILSTDEFCSYEEFTNSTFLHSDVQYLALNKSECQHACQNEAKFVCRGYTIWENHCLLHSADALALGPRLVRKLNGAVYMHRVKCLNMSVSCDGLELRVLFKSTLPFRGRLYASGYSDFCGVQGRGSKETLLRIPLSAGSGRPERCGITRAFSRAERNRTLLSTLLVVQNNPIIQTQGDRLVRVGCVLDESGKQEFFTPNDATLHGAVTFDDNQPMPSQGSIVINSSAATPAVTLSLLDTDLNIAQDAQLGQRLEMRIEITPADGPYDVRAINLIARSEDGRASILLLDNRGCPTDEKVFPALQEIRTAHSKLLLGRFQAFKFTGYPVVQFSALVKFCLRQCPPLQCDEIQIARERRSSSQETNNVTISDQEAEIVHSAQTSTEVPMMMNSEIPVQFKIIVYEPEVIQDKLIYGENQQILLAGVDDSHHVVCIDQTLIICIIVVWLLLQFILLAGCITVIRRYKKYADIDYDRSSFGQINDNMAFGYPSLSRRVTWADHRDSQNIMHT
ncbi:uncharacterized protein LOC113370637 [Ctenocephalides felis]|uniref:uncharacterized protein LOC113370637 n=1 Tax=Ctenocephalides felis TaxID=7515 RepID=UPI000E6E4686|nr:uncharacterized protein LOC113370637 [Ctenocephalides felis]